MFPTLPAWDALHPLVIHFPIALLMVAPLLAAAALFRGKASLGLSLGTLALMVIGTAGTWMAASTGEAAGELAERMPGVEAVLERHEELAELTCILFSVLTGIYAAMVLVPLALKRELPGAARLIVGGVFLASYAGALIVLANTAHEGGRLVHEFGVHAMIASTPAPEGGAVILNNASNDGDDD